MEWQRHVHRDADALADAVAGRIIELAAGARGADRFHLALAGGRTPRGAYRRLRERRVEVDWSAIEIWFGDERDVDPDAGDSNFRMARENLLDHVPLAAAQIHPMRTPGTDLRRDCARYERLLRTRLPLEDGWPRFDLILLGLGPDGHTASLFPNTCILHQRTRAVDAVYVPRLRTWRMSLTPPVFEHAARLLFVVSGADKAAALRQAWEEPAATEPPVRRIRPRGVVEWHVDRAAAGALREVPT